MNEKFGKILRAARDAAIAAGGLAAGAAVSVERKAEELASSARLRFRAATLEGEVEGTLAEVGELLYATHTGSPTDSDVLQKKLEKIDALKAELAEINGRLGRASAGKICPACGAQNRPGDLFCRSCGGRL